jgi:hypothetical protein
MLADLLQNPPSDDRKTNGKTWRMLCEAIADTLQDVTAKLFLNHGNHVATTWLINCEIRLIHA